MSGSVGLKLCLSRHAAGRIDDELALLPVDDVDLFVPSVRLAGEGWDEVVSTMEAAGFARGLREEALPHDFIDGRSGIVVSLCAEEWPEMGMDVSSFAAGRLGDASVRTMDLSTYEGMYAGMAGRADRIAAGKRNTEKLRLIRLAKEVAVHVGDSAASRVDSVDNPAS